MKLYQLITLFLALTAYIPMYGQGITIRQKLQEFKKNPSIHVLYDSNFKLDAPAKSVKWVKQGNNVILIPIKAKIKDKNKESHKRQLEKNTTSLSIRNKKEDVLTDTLEEVIVNADMNSQLLYTQMGKRTFSQEDFRKGFSFMSSPDILKTLQLVSGTASGVELSSGLYVHGGESDENLFLLDDSPLYQVNHSLGIFSSFNTDLVKNVDFYKSGFPARFNGRLSSITDVRTIDGNSKKLHGSFSLGLLDGRISLEGPIVKDKTTFVFGMRRSWLDIVTHPIFAIINHGKKNKFRMGYLFYDLNTKVTHYISENNKVYLSLYSGQDKYNTHNREVYDFNLSEEDNDFQWGNTNISLGWNKRLSPKMVINLIGTFTHNHTLQEYIDREESGYYDHSQSDYVSATHQKGISHIYDTGAKADIEYHPTSHHKIKAGISGIFHYFTTKTTQQLSYQDFVEESGDTSKVWGRSTRHSLEIMMFGEDEWQIDQHWSCHSGINLSRFQIEGKSYNQ